MSATSADWTPFAETPAEHMRPRFGVLTQPDYQLAYFRRGDSARLVAALDVPNDPVIGKAGLIGITLAVASAVAAPPRLIRQSLPDAEWTFLASVDDDSAIVSLEAIAPGAGAGRVRRAAGPPVMPTQRVALSDVMLLESADSLPPDLETAARRAARSSRVSPGALGLYWEVYGLEAHDTMTVSLTVVGHVQTPLARLGQRLGLGEAVDSVGVRWTDLPSEADGISERSIALNLQGTKRGLYTLKLEVSVTGQRSVIVSRDIELID